MDTRTFLGRILPERGVKFIASITPRPNNPKGAFTSHHPVSDADDAADKALELDRNTQRPSNVYFAMASFKEVITKTARRKSDGKEFTYPAGREQSNVQYVRCLWQDIDVGKPGAYATREEAITGLKQYCRAVGLDLPIIVSSGNGLHCYWVFSEDVTGDAWEAIAKYQRAAWKHVGVLFDPAADADCARVLRVPGTFHKGKDCTAQPRLVKVVYEGGAPLTPTEYKRKLKGYCIDNNLMEKVKAELPAHLQGKTGGNLAGVVPVYPDSHAAILVQHCKQMQMFSVTGGESEPLWWASIGVLKHCVDGEHYAHLWSSEHADYDKTETQEKFDQWSAGPTTCDRFRDIEPAHCSACQHKCRSPIQLGLDGKAEPPTAEPEVEPTPKLADSDLPTHIKEADDGSIFSWPRGFGYNEAEEMTFYPMADKDTGVIENIPVFTTKMYPVTMFINEDGTSSLLCRLWSRGAMKEFDVPMKFLGDLKALKSILNGYSMQIKNDKLMQVFLQEAAEKLRKHRDEINTYQQMGWHHNYKSFLLGDHLITEHDEHKVKTGKWLRNKDMSIFGTGGAKEEWIEGIDELYNRPNAEPLQLAIGNAFGSILNPLLHFPEWNGIPLALTSDDSGYSKSTSVKLANSIYMRQETKSLAIMENTTVAAIYMRASNMNNLPYLLDEVTTYLKDPIHMSDTLYALSNGGSKIRLRPDGSEQDSAPSWCGSCVITGNKGILHQLTESRNNPEATQMRIFEIDLTSYPRIATMDKTTDTFKELNVKHQLLTQRLLVGNYGVIGREWIRWVIKNRQEVEEKLQEVSVKLRHILHDESGDATKERFYCHWATCTLVALHFARKLGYVRFNLNNLRDWVIKHIAHMRGAVREYRNTPEDHFSSMMSTMVGKLIVTKHYDKLDLRSGKVEMPMMPINRTPVCGRLVLGDATERAKLWITTSAVMQWCSEQGINYTAFRRNALKAGLIRLGTPNVDRDTGAVLVAIGKGVPGYSMLRNPRCFEFDADIAKDAIPIPDEENEGVIRLNRSAA